MNILPTSRVSMCLVVTLVCAVVSAADYAAMVPTQDATTIRLGIARFEVHETAESTTVVGVDANGGEVGRLDLFRGRFALSARFAEGYDDPQVVGRRLNVRVLDQQLAWETEGFTPVLGLPAHPASQWALAAFLEEASIKATLHRWGIAFQSGEEPYAFVVNGTNPCECSGPSCPTVFGPTNNVCGGSALSTNSWIVHQRAAPGYQTQDPAETVYDQSFVVECCPADVTRAQSAFFSRKSCPDSPTCSGTSPCQTTCGPVNTPGRCRACPAYATQGKCTIIVEQAGWSDPHAPTAEADYCGEARTPHEQRVVYNVKARFAWECGDGICDVDENCASCAQDCFCEGLQTCGGGGSPGQCGCTPPTSCPEGYQCGSIDDGCGGTIDCSGGMTCDEIAGKKHYECDAASYRCCKHGRCDPKQDERP